MPYRNINIPQEDLEFIQDHISLFGGTIQGFICAAISNEIKEQKEVAQWLEERAKKKAEQKREQILNQTA